MPRLCLLPAGICLAILAFPLMLCAQDSKSAVTDLRQVDEDFAVQGEYSGRLMENPSSGWRSEKYGLQVVAQGGGQFRAALYQGGLPGSGWDRQTKFSLAGRRGAEGIELSGDGLRMILENGKARIGSAEKQLVGELAKVRRQSPTLGKTPPPGAVVLFNGEETEHLKGARVTDGGLLMEGVELTKLAQDFQLHLEFRLPYMPYARGQGRSNSGVYLHNRYEVQILDSFGLEGAHNEAGALYREHKPLVNMCLPPLTWQTYDIAFTAPRFDADGNKVENARITVLFNGVPVQKDLELESATGGGKRVGEGPNPLPIKLQNHGNPVRFRNIWMVDYTSPGQDSSTQTGPELASADNSASQENSTASNVNPRLPGPLPTGRFGALGAGHPYGNYWMDNLFPGGMVPGGVVPYYVPGYYPAPLSVPVVWGWE